jgi:hypothetical protein
LRTALVLAGTGTAGAYHAGVLRALHEAGVKIDLVAGAGVGAPTAAFAAVDGGARLWEANGVWRGREVAQLYRWRSGFRAAGWALLAVLALLLAPMAAAVVLVFTGFLLNLAGFTAGSSLPGLASQLLTLGAESPGLLIVLPRLLMMALLLLLGAICSGLIAERLRGRTRRGVSGPLWWRAFGAPLGTEDATARFETALWNLIRGAAPIAKPPGTELSRRYVDLLLENLGQPEFRELIVTAHDIDARRDLVFALLGEQYRRRFFGRRASPEADRRQADVLDLAGGGRDHAIEALSGALSVPVATEPAPVAFAPDGFWRGEIHRLCYRPDAVGRLLDEVAAAGAQQVIVVSAAEELPGPHALNAPRGNPRGRAGEVMDAFDAAAIRDAVMTRRHRFKGTFHVRPAHNPLGAFDFDGAFDERSDRVQSLGELVDRGYEDAYRQFIEPVVGASGEKLEEPLTPNVP